MSNVVQLPPADNPYLANCGIDRLSRALDLAQIEHAALLEYRLRRRDFERSHSLDDEARMVQARDNWASKYAARHGAAA